MPSVMTWELDINQHSILQRFRPPLTLIGISEPPAVKQADILVVGASALSQFVAWYRDPANDASAYPDSILLFLTNDAPVPDIWDCFDEIIRPGDLRALEALTQCPHVMKMQRASMLVNTSFLRELNRPIARVSAAEFRFDDPEWEAVDSFWRRHLAECVHCRMAFEEALELRLELAPRLMPPWFTMTLQPPATQTQAVRPPDVATAFLKSAVHCGLSVMHYADTTFREQSGTEELTQWISSLPDSLDSDVQQEIVKRITAGIELTSQTHDFEMELIEENGEAPKIRLHSLMASKGNDHESIEQFALELQNEVGMRWRGDSVEGSLLIPLSVLVDLLTHGNTNLNIFRFDVDSL